MRFGFPFHRYLPLLFMVLLVGEAGGQGWEKIYGRGITNIGYCVEQTTDGGYVTAGITSGGNNTDFYLVKSDINGDTLWTRIYGGSLSEWAYSIQQTTDGGYIVVGYTNSFGAGGNDVYLIKTDANGDTIWTKTYGGSNSDEGSSVQQTVDGGYIVAGMTSSFGAGGWDVYLIKTDVIGDTLWTKTYGGVNDEWGLHCVRQTTDGGYIIAARTKSFGAGMDDIYLIKTDVNGDTLWTKTFGGTLFDAVWGPNSVEQTVDGGYVIAGWTRSFGDSLGDIYLIKTDMNGDTLWTKIFGTPGSDWGGAVQQTTDGGYIIAATINVVAFNWDVYLIKTDVNGDTLWTRTYGGQFEDNGYSVRQTSDGGYVIGGWSFRFQQWQDYVYLIKTDSLGNTITNHITGSVFHDLSANCINDSVETGLTSWLIKVEPGPVYTTTDNGYYAVLVDTGTYTVTEIPPNNLWQQTCPNSPDYYTVNFTAFYDTSYSNDFANEITIYCPHLEVDISTWALRPCMNSTYAVSYCNTGTIDADNIYIEVEFDSVVSPISSTLPWSSQSGNTYTFNIGTLTPNQCGSFQITAAVSCNSVLGSTHCIEARIFPDTMCIPADSTWDKSSVAVEGYCVGDSLVCFTIYNTGDPGTGDMQGTSEYRIYENNILVSTGTFQLAGGDSTETCWPANGNTIRLEADQRPGHPGNSHPQDHIEICGGLPQTLGQIILVPEDDMDDNVEIDCRVITGSLDPNDKSVKPVGLTSNHYINSTDVLEYQINFQNTGTDTAFRVVIRDALSGFLDVTTVQSGASSHPYTFRIYGTGILEWTFDNILIPDSNINEPLSHGFVKYKVNQISNNPNGTLVENSVRIIFDFNAPVMTNTVWNIVYDTAFYDTTSSSVSDHVNYDNTIKVNVFPNPFNTETTFTITGLADNKTLTFDLYDIIGKKVKTIEAIFGNEFQINRENLTQGIYIYKVFSNKEIIGLGKLVVE